VAVHVEDAGPGGVLPGLRHAPAGECQGSGADVLLRVDEADGELLHQLPGVVLVGDPVPVALVGVQVQEHGRVRADPGQDRAQIGQGHVAPRPVLPDQERAAGADLPVVGREQAGQEEREPLLERGGRGQHVRDPPLLQLARVDGRVGVERLAAREGRRLGGGLRQELVDRLLVALLHRLLEEGVTASERQAAEHLGDQQRLRDRRPGGHGGGRDLGPGRGPGPRNRRPGRTVVLSIVPGEPRHEPWRLEDQHPGRGQRGAGRHGAGQQAAARDGLPHGGGGLCPDWRALHVR
jgi:hypothetical protein